MDDDERSRIGDDDPIMLRTAARLVFPDGSMNEVGLRKMRDRGMLECELIAGRYYTTLAAVARMRERCRVQPKAVAAPARQVERTKVDVGVAQAAALATVERLRGRSNETASAAIRASAERLRQEFANRSTRGRKPKDKPAK